MLKCSLSATPSRLCTPGQARGTVHPSFGVGLPTAINLIKENPPQACLPGPAKLTRYLSYWSRILGKEGELRLTLFPTETLEKPVLEECLMPGSGFPIQLVRGSSNGWVWAPMTGEQGQEVTEWVPSTEHHIEVSGQCHQNQSSGARGAAPPRCRIGSITSTCVSEDIDRKANSLAVFPETQPIHHSCGKLTDRSSGTRRTEDTGVRARHWTQHRRSPQTTTTGSV